MHATCRAVQTSCFSLRRRLSSPLSTPDLQRLQQPPLKSNSEGVVASSEVRHECSPSKRIRVVSACFPRLGSWMICDMIPLQVQPVQVQEWDVVQYQYSTSASSANSQTLGIGLVTRVSLTGVWSFVKVCSSLHPWPTGYLVQFVLTDEMSQGHCMQTLLEAAWSECAYLLSIPGCQQPSG